MKALGVSSLFTREFFRTLSLRKRSKANPRIRQKTALTGIHHGGVGRSRLKARHPATLNPTHVQRSPERRLLRRALRIAGPDLIRRRPGRPRTSATLRAREMGAVSLVVVAALGLSRRSRSARHCRAGWHHNPPRANEPGDGPPGPLSVPPESRGAPRGSPCVISQAVCGP